MCPHRHWPLVFVPRARYFVHHERKRESLYCLWHVCLYRRVATGLATVVRSLCSDFGRRYRTASAQVCSVEQSQGRVAAVNTPDSNSGMNVLRHAVASLNVDGRFFSRILASGGHLYSLRAVASDEADIAAIDCVSYQLIEDQWPELAGQVETIGYSVETCGLPFVIANSKLGDMNTGEMIERLNQALDSAPETVRKRLHLREFASVELSDYQKILKIEEFAIDHGYPELLRPLR